ncbi:MAG: glyoxalase/bleomycin resistance/extradiol dioxygenase family protein [Candidatus Accumulibacter propinquus]|jgi:predicted lactoylglutathione lyase
MVELTIIGPDRRLERTGRKRPEKASPLSANPFKLDVSARRTKIADIKKENIMIKQVFINLPVADVQKSVAFFAALGFSKNPQMSSDAGACIVMSDAIFVMLSTHDGFRNFTPKSICDTKTAVEVLVSLCCENREEVDGLVAKAIASGGSTYDKPEDLGFMYSHSFVDLDGHGWGLFCVRET